MIESHRVSVPGAAQKFGRGPSIKHLVCQMDCIKNENCGTRRHTRTEDTPYYHTCGSPHWARSSSPYKRRNLTTRHVQLHKRVTVRATQAHSTDPHTAGTIIEAAASHASCGIGLFRASHKPDGHTPAFRLSPRLPISSSLLVTAVLLAPQRDIACPTRP